MTQELPVVVILPFFNCEKLIEKASNDIVRILKKLTDKDIISELSYLMLVDYNSKDESWYEAGKAVAKNPRLVHAIKLSSEVKTSVILKKAAYCKNIVVNFKNYQNLEEYILKSDKSVIIDKMHTIKDLLKSSEFEITDQLP